MKKIAFITSHGPSLINFRGHLISKLVDLGNQVFAIAPNFDCDTKASVLALGATPIDCAMSRTGMNPFRDFHDAIGLSRLLRKIGPDVVFSYFVKPVIFGTLAARMAGVGRRIAMIEGLGYVFNPVFGRSLKQSLLKAAVVLLYRIALKQAKCVIFLNPDDLNELVDLNVVNREKTFHLGGIGVDLNKWFQTAPDKNKVIFILVARLLREKGIEDFANAARIVKLQYPQAEFVLLGDLDDNPGSIKRAEVQNWVDEGLLFWPGHVPVKPWLDKASVFVLPSYYREGMPLSIQEAMAVGRAVITSDAPGCKETVIDGVNGYLVPVRDVAVLAKRMSHFLEDPFLVTTMGDASRRLAEQSFDVHKVNNRIIDVMMGG